MTNTLLLQFIMVYSGDDGWINVKLISPPSSVGDGLA